MLRGVRKAPLRGAREAYGIQWVAKVVEPWDFLGFWAIFVEFDAFRIAATCHPGASGPESATLAVTIIPVTPQ